MKSTFTLPADAALLLGSLLDSEYKRERALLLINNASVDETVRKAFVDAVNAKGESNSMSELTDALKVRGMDDYIASVKKEALNELQTKFDNQTKELSDANQNVQTLTDENKQLKQQITDEKDFVQSMRTLLVDQVIDLSLALRKPEINLESVDDSVKTLREQLTAIEDSEELKNKLSQLRDELHLSFEGAPREGVSHEGLQDDDQNPGSTEDQDDADNQATQIEIKDMRTLLAKVENNRKQN